jgi:queuine tRNA-ribosyltransferase
MIALGQFRDAARPVEEGCPCEACAGYSRAYLSHLFHAKELLYHRLATAHNLQHYLELARHARACIRAGAFPPAPW